MTKIQQISNHAMWVFLFYKPPIALQKVYQRNQQRTTHHQWTRTALFTTSAGNSSEISSKSAFPQKRWGLLIKTENFHRKQGAGTQNYTSEVNIVSRIRFPALESRYVPSFSWIGRFCKMLARWIRMTTLWSDAISPIKNLFRVRKYRSQ